jgi:AcrR family transcriptional regulator
VAARVGVSLDDIRRVFREKEDIAEAFFDRADEAMLHAAEAPGFLDLPTPVRLHRVIMAWLEALPTHRRVTRQMIGGKLEPGHLHIQIPGLLRISRTVQWTREARTGTHPTSGGRSKSGDDQHLSRDLLLFDGRCIPRLGRLPRFLDRLLGIAEGASHAVFGPGAPLAGNRAPRPPMRIIE